jgi:hypothetical protein
MNDPLTLNLLLLAIAFFGLIWHDKSTGPPAS